MMLYFSISVLLNTSFFPTIERYMLDDLSFIGQTDSSLLEVMLENLLGMEDAGVTLTDDADDVPAVVDYLSTRAYVVITTNEVPDRNDQARDYDRPADPALKRTTPPPKA